MLKIGLVIASAGGPARMPALFADGFPEDAAWLILQRHADSASLIRLAEALEEMTGRKVSVARGPQALHGGDVLVLPSDCEYTFAGNRLQPQTDKGSLQLDRFLISLADAKAALACLLLTGPALEAQGAAGLKALGRVGAHLYALCGLPQPAQGAIDQALASGLVSEQLALQGALAQVKFRRHSPEAVSR